MAEYSGFPRGRPIFVAPIRGCQGPQKIFAQLPIEFASNLISGRRRWDLAGAVAGLAVPHHP